MHVLVGCGLGGGSLVNAGVALRPDGRVFADEVWPGQIAQDGLLDEGFRRAQRWLEPQSDPRAAAHTKFKSLAAAGKGIAPAPWRPTRKRYSSIQTACRHILTWVSRVGSWSNLTRPKRPIRPCSACSLTMLRRVTISA